MSAIYILWLREVKRYLRSRAQIIASRQSPLDCGISHDFSTSRPRGAARDGGGATISQRSLVGRRKDTGGCSIDAGGDPSL